MRRLAVVALLGLAACPAKKTSPPPQPHVDEPVVDAAPADVHELALEVPSGVTLHVRAIGSKRGRTAVLIHGGPGLSHEYMRPLERIATPELRVVSYDQRGAGRSTAPADGRYDFDAYADDLEGLREALGTEAIDLIGHSWGGLVAIVYAIKYPDHVRSMVLIDSLPPKLNEVNAGFFYLAERISELQRAGLIPEVIPPDVGDDCSAGLIAILPAYYADPKHPATKDLAGSSCTTAVDQPTRDQTGIYDLTPLLVELARPVLVVQGEQSPFTRQWHDAVVASLPAAALEQTTFPSCGHIPWEECPDPFWAVVEPFLAAH